MKSLRKRLRDAEKADARNASLKVDLDQTQTTLNAEIRSLQKQVHSMVHLQVHVYMYMDIYYVTDCFPK